MRFLILSTIFFISSSLFAQDRSFRAFRVDINVGYASSKQSLPDGSTTASVFGNGFITALEPKFSFNDYFSIGLRFENSYQPSKGIYSAGSWYTDDAIKNIESALLTADYHFNVNTLRPFFGVGVGAYGSTFISADNNMLYELNQTASKLGFMARTGIDAWHMRLSAEYNFAGKVNNLSNNYLGLKLGFFFGGGRLE